MAMSSVRQALYGLVAVGIPTEVLGADGVPDRESAGVAVREADDFGALSVATPSTIRAVSGVNPSRQT